MSSILKYGLITGIIYILWELLEYLLGLHGSKIAVGYYLAALIIVVPIVMMVLGIKAHRQELKGWLPLRKGIRAAFGISLISALMATTFMSVYTTAINPDYLDVRMEFERKAYFDKRKKQDATVSDNTARREAITQFPPYGIMQKMTSYFVLKLCTGLLIGLIITMWFRREPLLPGPPVSENGKE